MRAHLHRQKCVMCTERNVRSQCSQNSMCSADRKTLEWPGHRAFIYLNLWVCTLFVLAMCYVPGRWQSGGRWQEVSWTFPPTPSLMHILLGAHSTMWLCTFYQVHILPSAHSTNCTMCSAHFTSCHCVYFTMCPFYQTCILPGEQCNVHIVLIRVLQRVHFTLSTFFHVHIHCVPS